MQVPCAQLQCDTMDDLKVFTCILPFAFFLTALLHSAVLACGLVANALVLATLLPSQYASLWCTLLALQHPAADGLEHLHRSRAQGSRDLVFSRAMPLRLLT